MTDPDAEKTGRRLRLRRNLCRVSALGFGLAALALLGAAFMGQSFGRFAGQIVMLISFCAFSLLMARA